MGQVTREATGAATPAAADSSHDSLRGTGFWLLWANTVSIAMVMSADRFTFEWLVGKTLDAPDWANGLVLFALGAPVCLFVLVAGAMADRHDRRRMLVVTQFGGFAVLAACSIVVWTGAATVTTTMVLAVMFGTVVAFSQPVRSALLPTIVPRSNLMHAIVVMSIGSNVAMIIGPLIAGGAIQLQGVELAFAIQSLLFLAGMLLVWRMHVPALPPVDRSVRLRSEVADGLRFTWRHRVLRPLFVLLSVGGMLMYGAAIALLPKIARDEFGQNAAEASRLFALMGVGMIVTSTVLIKHRHRMRRRGLLFMLAMVLGTSNQVVQGFVPSFGWLELLLFLWGLTGGIYMNLNQTLIQELTPAERMGRVMSLTALANAGLVPFGALVSSALAGAIGPQPAMSVVGLVALACVLATLATARRLREQP